RTPRPAARADDGRDGAHQELQQLGVVDVGGGEADGERDPIALHDQVVLAAALTPVDRILAGLGAAALRSHTHAVEARWRPIDGALIAEPVQQRRIESFPDTPSHGAVPRHLPPDSRATAAST